MISLTEEETHPELHSAYFLPIITPAYLLQVYSLLHLVYREVRPKLVHWHRLHCYDLEVSCLTYGPSSCR